MAWQDLIRKIPVSRARLGAHHAFLVTEREQFYVVESGYVDLFAVVVDDLRHTLTRQPFIARLQVGSAFFGSLTLPSSRGGEDGFLAFQAVPSRNAVLLRGERRHFATRDDFDLDAVSLIDDWVAAASDFVSSNEPPPPRDAFLLEADPDVPYKARAALSTHHLEILWVVADRPSRFVGRSEFPVGPNVVLPLNERIWLTLADDARVSAVHTPGAIVTRQLWTALDRFNAQILRCAGRYWEEAYRKSMTRLTESRHDRAHTQGVMLRELAGLLSDVPAGNKAARGGRSALHAAAATVAESVGVQLVDPPDSLVGGDPIEAVDAMVGPSGIRTRRIALPPGWERRDGPSFVGVVSGEEPRPVAVVNRGRGAYEVTDPVTGKAAPVNRRRAESLEPHGAVFYPPLPRSVNSGLAALLGVLRGRGRDILGVVLMGCLGATVALLVPIVTGELLAEIIPRVDIPMWIAALAALALGAFTSAAFTVVGAFCMLRIEARIDETLQAAVWSRLLSLPLPFFRRYLAGDLADRANGVSLVRQLLTGATGSSILSGVFSVFSYGLLFYYSWELALWAGATVLVLAAGTWFFAMHQIRHHRTVFMAQGKIDGLVFQMILGLAKLRQANAEVHALKRWSERYVEQKRAHLSARKWAAGQHAFNALYMPAVQIVLLGLIWYSLIEGETPTPFALGDFLSFHAAFGQFVGGATGLTAAWVTVVTVLPLFERVQPILEAEPENAHGRVVLPRPAGRIEFRNVAFRYPSAASETLQDVSFHIRPGEYVAFVGPSGAGKSTVYRLLLGFEPPTTGAVLLDGHDLTTLDLSSMRRHLGVVLQNGQLIPDTIYNNIAGETSLGTKEVWDAARAAGIAEDIEALPMRMQTVVSESGADLSGGQKQRLLIARALARKPSVLLFDEATSMLDNRTQDTIRTTLRGLTITRVLIAHRLSTVVDADRIYVMQGGRVVESGRYEQLTQQDGVLAELARRQIV